MGLCIQCHHRCQHGPAGNGAGGVNGSGGAGSSSAGGGGGLLTDGGDASGGDAFVNGAVGGRAATSGGEGGFGGGGGASSWNNRRSGGGGGYSGGGGSASNSATVGFPEGGGGGSFNSGANQSNTASVGYGDGEIIVSLMPTYGAGDIGVVSIDEPSVFCSGVNDVIVSVRNLGSTRLDSFRVNWTVDNVLQAPFHYSGSLDTFNGAGNDVVQVTIGTFNFSASPHVIKAWTSNPNGGIDTTNYNDTLQDSRQANLPPPSNLAVSGLNPTNTGITWSGGISPNTWAYVLTNTVGTPTGPGTVVADDSLYVSNLTERTDYYFYVREICASGDSSAWAGPLYFRTPCANALSGTFTLNKNQAASATNFISFQDAALALEECGVSGPVDILVSADTYTERIELEQVPAPI